MDNRELKMFLLGGGILFAIMILIGSQLTAQTNAENERIASPSKPPPGYTEEMDYGSHPDKAAAYVNTLILRTKGKFDRLSPEERNWINGASRGHGAEMFIFRYKKLTEQPLQKAKTVSVP
ncbi:MAG: hypothetical protein H7308_17885 [Chthonomonadaceae bacterium]|nr:hypothetical protein [Chthonomonadaceae bacterium]